MTATASTERHALDSVLTGLRRQVWEGPSSAGAALLHAAATTLGANALAIWLFDDAAAADAFIRYPVHADDAGTATEGGAPPPQRAALLTDGVASVDRRVADNTVLDAGIWVRGVLAGALSVRRPGSASWTADERTFVVALAERMAVELVAGQCRQGELALRERRQQLDLIEELAGLGSWEIDMPTGRVRWSREQRRIHGVDEGGAPATHSEFLTMVHPDDRQVIDEGMAALAGGDPVSVEFRARRPDGAVRRLQARARIVPGAGGRASRVLGTSLDVTDRRDAERILRDREDQVNRLERLAEIGSWQMDVTTGRIVWSREQLRIHGLPLDQPERSEAEFLALVHPDDRPRIVDVMTRLVLAGEPFHVEYRIVRPDDQVRLLRAVGQLVPGPDGQLTKMIGTSQDITDRRATELALRASEASYRAIFEGASDAMWLHDIDTGTFIEANHESCEMYGYSMEEQLALGVEGISANIPPYTIDGARGYIEGAAAGIPQRFEWLGRHRDGHLLWNEVRLRRVTVGGKDRILATGRDINDRKRAEAALREAYEELERRVSARTAELAASNAALAQEAAEHARAREALQEREEYFRRLIENSSDQVLICDATTGAITYVGPSVERILGYRPEEMLGLRPPDNMHPDDVPHVAASIAYLAAHPGEVTTTCYRTRHKDGSWRTHETVARTLAPDSADAGIVANSRDITDRVNAERALREREEHFRRLIENSSDQVMIVDVSGAITYVGPSVERLLGWTPEEMLGQRPADLVHPDDAPGVMEAIGRLVARPSESVTVQYRIRHKDGRWRVFENVANTLVAGSVEGGLVANCRDITERVEAERALRDRDMHFRRLIENSSDHVMIVDRTAAITYVAPSVERMLGWTPDEMMGQGPNELVHPDDLPQVLRDFEWIVAHPGEPYNSTFRIRHKDGSYRVFENLGRTLSPYNADEGVLAFGRDITERRAAEEALERSTERWRATIENAHDIVTILDPEGRMGYQSPALTRVTGFTPEELDGESAFAYMHPDDAPEVIAVFQRVLAEPGSVGHAQYRFRHKDGSWRHLEAFGRTLSPTSAELGLVANVRDVTDRLAAERALRERDERFRRIIENTSDYVMMCDADARITYISPSGQRMLGWTPEEMLGAEPRLLVHPDDVALVLHDVRWIFEHPGQSLSTTYRIRHKDGSYRVFDSVGRTVSPDSADEGLVTFARDVTARQEAEAALARAKDEAERANRAKSEFLSRMSHELRTPMNSILGFAQLLARGELPPTQAKSVQHILKAGRHLLHLINEVLEIARIEAGREDLSLEPVALAPLLQEAMGLVRPLAQQWGVELREGPSPRDVFVHADRQRLVQVLLNLLSNAIKYNRTGGYVRLGCVAADDGRWAVRVEDGGRGIPAERVDQLFTPFARLGAEQTEVEGTGLGLALSRRLCEAMGGALVLESSDATGSVFRVDLGGASDPLNALEDTGTWQVATTSTQEATLLYVEDNLANLSLVDTILLSRPGWRTLPALQGQLGVELAREHLPDVILLDLHLPDIPGDEVLRRLRADPRTASIPVIIVSADATPSSLDRLRVLGADAYLTKPLDVDDFLRAVERFLPDGEASADADRLS